jgi:hypothetical protein
MTLNSSQLTVLKAAINAETDPTFVAHRTNGATNQMADFYNVATSFYVWSSNYTVDQIADAIDNGITQLDSLTGSKRESLLWWADHKHDMTKATAQAAINDLCGSQNTLKAAILDGGKRVLKRGEALFSSGTGSLAIPGATTFEGSISDRDITNALSV